jgi:HK97 family phage major capsid protein
VFDIVSETVKTVAEWVAATKRVVSDASQLRAYIDAYLTDDLAIELEDQMVAGAGGNSFTGILNTVGINEITTIATGRNIADQIRSAKTLIRTLGRTMANGVVLNPADSERMDLLKDGELRYLGSGPFGYVEGQPIWGLRRVESEAVPEGTALVGDFRRAVLFDRENTAISVGTAGLDFIRNIIRILAELRAGFGVLRPKAFCSIDLTAVAA